jgi:RNA polymerase sigma factor (sigma-70 family)
MEERVDEYDVSWKNRFSATYEQWVFAKYLAALPDKEREIVYLYYHEDKSYEEIADIVGSNKNTVWTLLSQAKKKIYAMAGKEGTLDLFT